MPIDMVIQVIIETITTHEQHEAIKAIKLLDKV